MGRMTESAPKCLTQLAGQALIQWQLSALHAAGVQEFCIVRGYQKQKIQMQGCEYRDNPRWASSNMLRSLQCAQDLLMNHEVIVCYSDILFHPHHVQALLAAQGDIRITYDLSWKVLWKQRFDSPLDDAETFSQYGGRLLEIGQKTSDMGRIDGQYMGLTAITPRGWQQIQAVLAPLGEPELDKLDMTSLFSLLLEQGIGIAAVPVDGKWCEVDTEHDYNIYRKQLQKAGSWKHDWRWQ